MTTPQTSGDYSVAWKSLPRNDRALLVQAAMRGHRCVTKWDAAITLWWTQRELRVGLWRDLGLAGILVAGLIAFAWARTGQAPSSLADIFNASPLLPVFLLIPIAASSMRRPRLRRSAQLNAAVLAGKSFEGPPDAEEAERLLALARRKGWFRGTRPQANSEP